MRGSSVQHRMLLSWHTYRTVFTTLMRNQGMKQRILRYIRGDTASETMDIYATVVVSHRLSNLASERPRAVS